MANDITIHLYEDWLETVKEVFRGSGQPLPADLTPDQVGLAYFLQTAPSKEAAKEQRDANELRLTEIQEALLTNFEAVVLPDLRRRTSYEGSQFAFKWVYNQGEHIIEAHSSYRIPL
ncbi:hypothetical protein [Paenibacillus sp. R14(2021)]|uniref:hypothetical protein n=1 Tax=Paenibacillus sp. R14(2021) TaxID=2859228 RepID=UPI001C616B2C|nr:hypothetical protein [Paenibacillus sp. R14(2021)]